MNFWQFVIYRLSQRFHLLNRNKPGEEVTGVEQNSPLKISYISTSCLFYFINLAHMSSLLVTRHSCQLCLLLMSIMSCQQPYNSPQNFLYKTKKKPLTCKSHKFYYKISHVKWLDPVLYVFRMHTHRRLVLHFIVYNDYFVVYFCFLKCFWLLGVVLISNIIYNLYFIYGRLK